MKRLIAVLLVLAVLLLFTLIFINSDQQALIALPGSVEGLFSAGSEVIKSRVPKIALERDQKEENERILALAAQITAGLEDEYARLEAVYDWVTTNIDYDLEKAANLAAYGSGALYALEHGRGVCHDYAKLTLSLLTAAGLKAEYRSGEVAVTENETELHAWNEAVAGGLRYALDTTWGAGFMLEDKSAYICLPRKIFLTTPEDLARLHSDPLYKQQREEAYMKEVNAGQPAAVLLAEEEELLAFFNRYRNERGLPALDEEKSLLVLARRYAEEYAEATCRGEEIELDSLSAALSEAAPSTGARSAGLYALIKWLYPGQAADEIYEDVTKELSTSLNERRWQALALGLVRKGDLLVAINLFLEY